MGIVKAWYTIVNVQGLFYRIWMSSQNCNDLTYLPNSKVENFGSYVEICTIYLPYIAFASKYHGSKFSAAFQNRPSLIFIQQLRRFVSKQGGQISTTYEFDKEMRWIQLVYYSFRVYRKIFCTNNENVSNWLHAISRANVDE